MYLVFLCTIFIWPCDLDLRAFDLGGVWWLDIHSYNQRTYRYLASYDYPFLSYRWLNLITLPSHETVTAHAPCHVTYHRGGQKTIHIFEIPGPNLPIRCHFRGATTKIKPCNRRKIAFFPLWRLQSSLRMRSVTWPVHRGSHKTTRNNFWHRIAYSLYNFYEATTTIKSSLYWSIPCKAIFGREKSLVKIRPKMAAFCEVNGLNIRYSHRDPKRHFLTQNNVIWHILRKNPSRGVGCSLIEKPKKTNKKTSHPKSTAESRIWGAETPKPIATKFYTPGAVQYVITHANFDEDWLDGFGVARGRILAFSVDLLRRLYKTLALPCEWVIMMTMKRSKSLQTVSRCST